MADILMAGKVLVLVWVFFKDYCQFQTRILFHPKMEYYAA